MNIFEFLGLRSDHRKLSNKVTQLVKHWDEVVEKNKAGKTFALQTKSDGVCTIVIVQDGMPTLWSRTGNQFTNTDVIMSKIGTCMLPDAVYFGEMVLPKELASLEVLSGMVNPNRTSQLDIDRVKLLSKVELHFFDAVGLDDFVAGKCDISFATRHLAMRTEIHRRNRWDEIRVLEYATTGDVNKIEAILQAAIDSGEEGIVIRDLESDWVAGHKGYRAMKMVRGVDYDLECIGFEEGTGKYTGKVANLIFKWKGGLTVKCMLGKGWTHDMAEDMFDDCHAGRGNSPIGKIFQVYALEESSKGKLRLPKVGEQRFDKEVSDV